MSADFLFFLPGLCYDRCLSAVQISDLMTLCDFRIIIPDDFGTICVLFYRILLTKNCHHLCGPFSTGSALCLQRSRIVARLTRTSIRFRFVYQLIKRRKATSQAIGVDSGHKPSANTTESSMYFPHTLSFRTYRSVVRSIDSLQARAIAD